jgi:hypothetical protein
MGRIRSFLYRSPRFTADCRMDFIQGDTVTLGTCTDISESGLRGTFSVDVAPGSQGLLTLYHAEQTCQMQAKVHSIRNKEVRIRFRFDSDKERDAMAALIKFLSTQSPR